jgi:hypothetical protein
MPFRIRTGLSLEGAPVDGVVETTSCASYSGRVRYDSFEQPYRQLLADALVQVRPNTGDFSRRLTFARIAHFALQSVTPDERAIAGVLGTVMASTDHADVIRYLLCGVWFAASDDQRNLRWCTKAADRALERGHLAGFAATLQLLVHIPSYDGHLSATRRASSLGPSKHWSRRSELRAAANGSNRSPAGTWRSRGLRLRSTAKSRAEELLWPDGGPENPQGEWVKIVP